MEIVKLVLKNFRSHKSKTIEFKSGVTAIIGGNGSGKSSIVEAVSFLLTGEGYSKSKADMITVGQVSGYVIGHMLIDGKEAVLERHLDTAKVNFSYDGKVYKKSGEVNEVWDKLFQIDKNIVQNVIISNQGEISLLFNGDSSTKEKLFQKIFMVPNTSKIRDVIWNNYIKEAPPEYPVKDEEEIKSNLQCLEKLVEMSSQELALVAVDDSEYEQLLERRNYLARVESSMNQQDLLSAGMLRALEKSRELDKEADQLRNKISQIDIASYRDCLAEQKANKTMHETKLFWQSKKESLLKPAVEVDKTHIQGLRQKAMELEASLKTKRELVQELNNRIAEYQKSGLASGVCPTCGTKVDNIKGLIEHAENERAPIIEAGKLQKNELSIVQQELAEQEKHLRINEEYDKEQENISASLAALKDVNYDPETLALCEGVINKHAALEAKLSQISKDVIDSDRAANSYRVEIAKLATYDKDIGEFSQEQRDVAAKIEDLQKKRAQAKTLELEIAGNNREIKTLKQDLQDNKHYLEKNKKRAEYIGVLKNVYDLFHTGKFPRALIQTYSSTVTEYMNEVLASFDFPYSAKVNETFGIDVFNEEELKLPSVSGGQQVMVGFSLRLALHNMFVGAFPLMIVDEGSYGLTDENAQKYFEIIKSLGKSSKFKQVIVIDHHSELAEYVDNTITL